MGSSGSRGLFATGSPSMGAQSLVQKRPWARHRLFTVVLLKQIILKKIEEEKKIEHSHIMETNDNIMIKY